MVSTLKVNTIKRQSGTTITIGESGDTITIASGAAMGGSGASLTALNATELTTGTVPDARFPATLPAASGVNLTALNATQLTSGTVPAARLSGLGKILQAKQENLGQMSTAATDWTEMNSFTITPTVATSIIYGWYSGGMYGGATGRWGLRLTTNSTGSDVVIAENNYSTGGTNTNYAESPLNWFEDHDVTSEITYKIWAKDINQGGTVYVSINTFSPMFMMEVSTT